MEGTQLYESIIGFDYGSPERNELQRKVWDQTPWVVDVYVGRDYSDRQSVYDWLRQTFGPEAWPIHEQPGKFHTGGAIVQGWQWVGFQTESQMDQFTDWLAKNGPQEK